MNRSKINKLKHNDSVTYSVEVPSNFKLYKMRPISEYSLSAFINDELWGTLPSAFNDPYDSSSIYNRNELYKYSSSKLKNNDKLINVLCEINMVENSNNAYKVLGKMLVDSMLSPNDLQKSEVLVSSCFTEKVDNEIMWAHYASNAEGFALEYEYDKLKEFSNKVENASINFVKRDFNILDIDIEEGILNNLVPIIYDNKKYNMTEYYKKVIDNEINTIIATKINNEDYTIKEYMVNLLNLTSDLRKDTTSFWESNCFKKPDWRYEHEWRLLAYNMNPYLLSKSAHYMIGHIIPSAIYLGEKILEYNRLALIEITKKKNIKIYQMKTKTLKKSFKLTYKEIKY